jgi:hypothetical protein
MIEIPEPENLKVMAHIVDGVVVDVSLWDGVTKWKPLDEIAEIPEGSGAGIGWDYIDGEFVDNRPIEVFEIEGDK